jgi:ubiquinone/menaquinone biosynthesis C-methylase UbiE
MRTTTDENRFENGAQEYAAYLETPDGRLRADLAFANVLESLPAIQESTSMYALDLGCGTGATSIKLAHIGFHVSQLDSSAVMLQIAKRTADETGVANRITSHHGDAAELTTLFAPKSFDLVVCHSILEYLDDPAKALCSVARLLRNDAATLSILVRNRPGEVLNAALRAGDLAAADRNLTAEFGTESLYGGTVRLFTRDAMLDMLNNASLSLISERGVRVIADYLPSCVSRNARYAEILELEKKLGTRPEFAQVARYMQYIARCNGSRLENPA